MNLLGISPAEQQINIDEAEGRIDAYFTENSGLVELAQKFKEAAAWASTNSINQKRLFVGEFGAILIPPDYSKGTFEVFRSDYMKAVRTIAEIYGMPWSMWEYSNPHGMSLIVPTGDALPDTDLLRALGLIL